MSVLRQELVNEACQKAYALTDYNIHDIDKEYEFRVQFILADESLTNDEKSEAIRLLNSNYDEDKIRFNEGKKRICENCQLECLATLFCERCIRNYLKRKFSNWTSGNNDIDDLIQECQMKTFSPNMIIEWVPYNNLQNIKYLTKGGFSEIYIADWIGGFYYEWDSIEQQLERCGTQKVILKRLEDVKSANRSWFEEAKSHLTISNKWSSNIAQCLGLTRDPLNNDYMLVINKMDIDLRNYLKQNHNRSWKERILISYQIITALLRIHTENAIHRDLHSGNILYFQELNSWYISDLGFCGPVDKPLGSIYGNLPYIAPEVIAGKGYTFASDIYGIAMLMWEISSGQPPFAEYGSDYDLAMNIINGMRPKIVPGIPLEYKELMEQCWDADPEKRPDINAVYYKMEEMNDSYYRNESEQQTNNNIINLQSNANSGSTISLVKKFSKLHIFENLPEPRNATEEEQEVFHSRPYDFAIPDNDPIASENQNERNDFTMVDDEKKKKSKRIYSDNSDDEKEYLSNKSKKIKLENKGKRVPVQYSYEHMRRSHVSSDNEDDIYNDSNIHSEDQDELEIPEDGF